VLSDRREFDAEIVATDEQSDLAILRLKTDGELLPFLSLHDSDSLEVGDLLLAIGNPFGVGQTVTSGIVSAVARAAANINDYAFFIQTDAAINPGNSGGALVDMSGNLIGVPTAIYSRSGGSIGIGFAIPSNMVRALLSSKAKNGKIVKPWLGAQYQSVTRELAESLGLKTPAGALVSEVFEGSPADKAGLQVGDVVLGFNGKPVEDVQGLRFRTATASMGEPAMLTIRRKGKEQTVTVQLSTPPEEPARDVRKLQGGHPLNGVSVANLNPALATEMNISPTERGVIVVATDRHLRVGDRVLKVNDVAITSSRQLEELMAEPMGGWNIQLKRGNQVLNMAVMP
jgi:serine protease Do